ncbi:MAG: DNA-binding protein [Desulfurococcaceae archaeon]
MDVFIFTIKPFFAHRIFTGKKKFELRRYLGYDVKTGDRIIVYVSGRIKAFIGEFIAGRVITGSAEYVIKTVSNIPNAGVSNNDFKYIAGATRAMAIEIVEPMLYDQLIELKQVRRIFPDFMPPPSMKLIDRNDPILLLLFDRMTAKNVKTTREKST